jgi:hypothetical protein
MRVNTSPIEIIIEGICGRLRLINATAKDARVSSSHGSRYEAGTSINDATATGIASKQIPPRYNLDRNGVSLHFMVSREP